MIQMLQNVVFAFAFLAVLFLLGTLLLHLAGWKQTLPGAVAWGFVVVLGVFQLTAYPLYLAKASFTALFCAFSAISIALLAASVVICVRRKCLRAISDEAQTFCAGFRQAPLPVLVLAFMALLLVCFGVFYYSGSPDDGYYLPRAMEVMARDSLAVSHSIGWFGVQVDAVPESADASTLEFFKAYLSRLSGIHVTALCRNGFEIALTVVCLCGAWTFADVFSEGRAHAFSIRVYTLILYLAVLLLDLGDNTNSFWITHHLWQGKAMLPGVLFPLLFAACGRIMQHIGSFGYREWLPVMLTLLAGVAASITGVFLMPILYVLIGGAFLAVTRLRHFGRIAPCAVVSALPVIATAAVTFVSALKAGVPDKSAQTTSWIGSLTLSTDKFVFVLFLLCAAYIARRGTTVERALFAVMPALLFATFLNPLFMPFVSTYVTSGSVYWRLFWLLPTLLVPAYVIPTILLRHFQPRRLQNALITACAVIGLLAGAAWSHSGFSGAVRTVFPISATRVRRDNIYKIDRTELDVAESVLKDWRGEGRPVLLYYDSAYPLNEVRQYTEKIVFAALPREKQAAYKQALIPGTEVRECDFYMTYKTITDGAFLHEMLTRLGIDYVCFYGEPACAEPETCGFTVLYRGSKTLWRVDAQPG